MATQLDKAIIGIAPLGNFAANAAIGSANSTVDRGSAFSITQTTPGITLTIPNPTTPTPGQQLVILNTGTVAVTVGGVSIAASRYASFCFAGSAWLSLNSTTGTITTLARVVANTLSATGSAGSGTAITAAAELLDTTNSFTPGTGVFVAPRTGKYLVSLQVIAAATAVAGSRFGVILSTNGAAFGSGSPIISCYCHTDNPSNVCFGGSYIKLLNAGDQLTCRLFNDAATSCNLNTNANFDYLNINELPDTNLN